MLQLAIAVHTTTSNPQGSGVYASISIHQHPNSIFSPAFEPSENLLCIKLHRSTLHSACALALVDELSLHSALTPLSRWHMILWHMTAHEPPLLGTPLCFMTAFGT